MGSDTLFTLIEGGLVEGRPDDRRFLPHDTFEELWTGDGTNKLIQSRAKLARCFGWKRVSKLIGFVRSSARKVFAILVRSDLAHKVSSLPKYGFMDKHLPVVVEGTDVTSYNLLADDMPLKWFRDWSPQEKVRFREAQWLFLAPIFVRRSIMEQLHNECPLPFIEFDKKASGSFSVLYRARIHKRHIECVEENHEIAVKELEDDLVTDKAYEVEVDALEVARQLDHPHFVSFIGGFERAGKRYVMFKWVDGGNLREFWRNHSWSRNAGLIRWALGQMKGIADGLEKLHFLDPKKQDNCRHGDLKPENIVRSQKPGPFGLLQIADMGLAKIHSIPTALRPMATTTLAGTIRYQPPEIQTSTSGTRSRSYDVWSMGCILFELIIWLLLGPEGLKEFESSFDNNNPTQPFYHLYESNSLRPNVNRWKRHIEKTCLGDSDRCVSLALKRLFNYVCTALLVEDPEQNDSGFRIDSLKAGGRQATATVGRSVPQVLFQRATTRVGTKSRDNSTQLKKELEEICSIYSEIDFYDPTKDSEATREILKHQGISSLLQVQPARASPRSGARPQIQIADDQRCFANYRDNCSLDSGGSKDNQSRPRVAQLLRTGSSLAPSSTEPPLLSIVVGPGCNNSPSYIQRGFPVLPKPESRTRARLFNHWLQDCDKSHTRVCSRVDIPRKQPKRLLDLGDSGSSTIKLDCYPDNRKSSEYVILSHPWGTDKSKWFRTTSDNIDEFKRSIDFKKLPRNFQDAVTVTKNLGFRYLWIDSICIIQEGKDADFHTEKEFMEDYYGGASCTIAASSASGMDSGFLRPHFGPDVKVRRSYTFHSGIGDNSDSSESAFHICDAIDDFASDVEESNLSTRGWVFQERALSRRTLHFTKNQVYWECGKGVRCETMTKLFNRKSSFLSDPHFPDSAAKYYKGMRIEFFQYIYSKYSGLAFSKEHEEDRSVALRGLEKRMARVYNVRGGHGILDGEYLQRSLLWQRDTSKTRSLRSISYERNEKVPSWSWMAVMGQIAYMDAPFDWMDWNDEIKSPLGPQADFEVDAYRADPEDDSRSTYDREEETGTFSELKCVIIGREKMEKDTDPTDFYVLLIAPTGSSESCVEHKRVGVARLTRDEIIGEAVKVKIV
ncbi:hypothetical protein O1611_g3997 [Lasiodiplodia mahajangana]|uniref:Uncharacterized protein n=1 Tax=Lasiodiplodia mahajangana TaxID=1108764 RepID=A0ACC2JQ53_9PEZI|nr:hypothetical protein O1611_g3997 [Lasiodiplodia mahajangana]